MKGVLDNKGFTYLTALFMIALIGLVSASAGKVYSFASQREKEEELLFRGMAIKRAIERFYNEGGDPKRYPKSVDELVRDDRWPTPKRHLRRLYTDPMTGTADWNIVRSPDGGIMGLKSKSKKEAIKRSNFPMELSYLSGKTKYSEWEFTYVAKVTAPSNGSGANGNRGAVDGRFQRKGRNNRR